jgi:hypothetical protein
LVSRNERRAIVEPEAAVRVETTSRLSRSLKQRILAAAPGVSSAIRSFHVPAASCPCRRESGCSGRKMSFANGGFALWIGSPSPSPKRVAPKPHGAPMP